MDTGRKLLGELKENARRFEAMLIIKTLQLVQSSYLS